MNYEGLKGFVNNPLFYTNFVEMLAHELEVCYKTIENTSDTLEIFRLQGRIGMIKKMMKLRERVNGEPT